MSSLNHHLFGAEAGDQTNDLADLDAPPLGADLPRRASSSDKTLSASADTVASMSPTAGDITSAAVTASAAASSSGLDIVVSFDSSVTDLPTAEMQSYESAVATAVAFYESEITTPITVHLSFGFGEVDGLSLPANAGGASVANDAFYSYTQLYNAVKAVDTAPTASATQRAALALLPSSDPTSGQGLFIVDSAEAKALGLTTNAMTDGWVGLSSALTYSWSQSGVVGSGDYDAVGILEHEISEDLGRVAYLGKDNDYSLLDFYHYSAAGDASGAAFGSAVGTLDEPFVGGYNPSADAYFYDGGGTVTLAYDTPTDVAVGDDVADWSSSVTGDAYGAVTADQVESVSATDLQEINVLGYSIVCYLAGTRILTDHGEIAVEDLAIGEQVITESGEPRPIRWIGRRSYAPDVATVHPDLLPICIRAGAIADGIPKRDLFVSACHAFWIDGVLIPAAALVNGNSIFRATDVGALSYVHVELDSHDIIFAEGVPAETYLDLGNRSFFQTFAGSAVTQVPNRGRPRTEVGPDVDRVWSRLASRADSMELHQPHSIALTCTGRIRVCIPAGVTSLQLLSDVGTAAGDSRPLGALLSEIRLDTQPIALSDARLLRGFHGMERHGQAAVRWTNGRGVIAIRPRQTMQTLELEVAHLFRQPPGANADTGRR